MVRVKHYKQIIAAIILAGIMVMIALRISYITSWLGKTLEAFVPLVVGACIAFVLDILIVRYERFILPNATAGWKAKLRRPLCLTLALLTIGLILYVIARMAIPQLVHSLSIIVTALPTLYNDFESWVSSYVTMLPDFGNQAIINTLNGGSMIGELKQWGTKGGTYIVNAMGSVVEWTFNIIIGLIFAIYMLLDKERLLTQTKRILCAYLPDKRVEQGAYVGRVAIDTFSNFFVGQFLDALVLGVLVGITLALFNISYALTIACVIGLTGLIPLLGIYIGGVMGAIILLTVSPMEAFIYVVILEVLHQIESNFIYPKIVGNSVGLPGLWVFAAVIVGGSLYGVVGMIAGVPLVATIYKLLMEDVDKRLSKPYDTSLF